MNTEIDPRYQAILRVVEKYCLAHENPLNVDKYAHYFREGYDAYGLTEDELNTLRDQILADHSLTVSEYAELGWHLFATGKYEFGSLAILLLKQYQDCLDKEEFAWIKKWLDNGVENWAHVDTICSNLLGDMLESGTLNLEDFSSWRSSDSKWTRRAVPVALLNLRKSTPPEELLEFLDPMMTDRERVVHQGLGWFLRELWKLDHTMVEDFLVKHKQHCDRLIIQYATEKMNGDKRKRFHKDKANKAPNPQIKKNVPKVEHRQQKGIQVTPKRKPPRKVNHE